MVDVKLEELPNGADSAKIVSIAVAKDDELKKGDIIVELESDKSSLKIKTDLAGTVGGIEVSEGDEIKKGDLLITIDGESSGEEKSISAENSGEERAELEADIAIIGAGPGGYVAAIKAAQNDKDVVLIEKDEIGGTCLNRGCIPTKAMVRSGEVYNDMKDAGQYGLDLNSNQVSVDMKKVVKRKDRVVKRLVKGVEHLLKKHGVEVIEGEAKLSSEDRVLVKKEDDELEVKAENIIIGTGSKVSNLPITGIELNGVIDSNQALELDQLPEKIVIVGGGYIGMEFAFIFANFDVEVTVVEYLDQILSISDKDVRNEINKMARRKGIKILTGSRVDAVREAETGELVVEFSKDEKKKCVIGDKVLMSVGREPYFDGLGIEDLGIELDENERGIKVNKKMQTNILNIYAIGDVTDEILLAHVASHQAVVAVENILGNETEMDYTAVPSAIFTDPEIASVGLNEEEAAEEGIDFGVGYFPFRANGKALAQGERDGFIKMIQEKDSGKIIGADIIGTHASDLLGEVTLAIENELTAEEISDTIHAHPTTAEVIYEAALDLEGGAIHYV